MVTAEECRRLLIAGAITKPDADISGRGVILAFLISAYVSFATVLGAYASGMVEQELLASVDTKVMRVTSHVTQHPKLHRVLQQTVLVLSDQQIVTGIAIMLAGFVGLCRSDISVYHYQIVLYLAWLSSSVHLSALTMLRPFLNTHPGIRAWRLAGVISLFFMLIIGLVPTISNDWGIVNVSDTNEVLLGKNEPTGWGVPAVCFWGKTYGDGVNNDAPIGYLLLIISYIWKVGDMFVPTRNFYGSKVRKPLERIVELVLSIPARRYIRTRRKRYLWCFRFLLVPSVPFIALLELLASFAASLWLSVLGLVFGTVQVVIPRNQNLPQTGLQENAWGFGQLVPLVLLIQPLGVISEYLWPWPPAAARAKAEVDLPGEASRDEENTADTGISPDEHASSSSAIETHHGNGYALIAILGSPDPAHDTFAVMVTNTPRFVDVLLSSRILAVLVTLLQVTLLGGTCIVLYFDVISIGISRGQNWQLVLVALAFYVATSWITMLVLGPYSRLGRGLDEARDSSFSLYASKIMYSMRRLHAPITKPTRSQV